MQYNNLYNEIRIDTNQIVLVYSKKLNQTMAIHLSFDENNNGHPLTGSIIKTGDVKVIRERIADSVLSGLVGYTLHDFDKGGKFIVVGHVNGNEIDYAVSVEEENGELKIVMLPSNYRERNSTPETKDSENDRDTLKVLNYVESPNFRPMKAHNKEAGKLFSDRINYNNIVYPKINKNIKSEPTIHTSKTSTQQQEQYSR